MQISWPQWFHSCCANTCRHCRTPHGMCTLSTCLCNLRLTSVLQDVLTRGSLSTAGYKDFSALYFAVEKDHLQRSSDWNSVHYIFQPTLRDFLRNSFATVNNNITLTFRKNETLSLYCCLLYVYFLCHLMCWMLNCELACMNLDRKLWVTLKGVHLCNWWSVRIEASCKLNVFLLCSNNYPGSSTLTHSREPLQHRVRSSASTV